jgi:acetyl-CoA carboxylase alpha subunit
MAKTLRATLLRHLQELQALDPSTRIEKRIERFASMGVYGHES